MQCLKHRCESCELLHKTSQDAQEQKSFTVIEVATERDELSERS